jgi:hypothetical protein
MLQAGRAVPDSERTRWQVNRYMYRGQQWLRVVGSSVRSLAPTDRLPPGRRRYTVNRARQFLEARVAMLSASRPPFAVEPASKTQEAIDGARLAEKLIDAHWGTEHWDLDAFFRSLTRAGEIDGVVWACVLFDKARGRTRRVPVDASTGEPIADPAVLAAVQAQDPFGERLWTWREFAEGEIVFRVVRPGSLAVDPFMTTDFADCRWVIESRVRPRSEVEREIGRSVEEVYRAHQERGGTTAGTGASAGSGLVAVQVDDQEGQGRVLSGEDAVVVHELFHLKGGYFPRGAHIKWLDVAPSDPILQEPWLDDELPYFPFTPRPDGTHILRSRGTMDDLAPIQVMFNKTLSQLGEWLDKVANPPLIVQNGALKTKDIYSDKGVILVHGGMAPPEFMRTPAEPTAVLTNYLNFLIDQMAEAAAQQDATRGVAPGKGIEAAVSLQSLVQQNEQVLSGTEAELVRVMEWTVTRALKLVYRHYSIPRLVNTPGVDSIEEFDAFVGSMLKGCHKFRITGSLLPQSRAAQVQLIMQMAQYGRLDLQPFVADLVEGRVDRLVEHERRQAERQRRENRRMLALGRDPALRAAWSKYETYQVEYQAALRKLAARPPMAPVSPDQMVVPGLPGTMPAANDPAGYLASKGVMPPTPEDAGIPIQDLVPKVEEWHDHARHVLEIDDLCVSDVYDDLHPLVKLALDVHRQAHLAKLKATAQAVAAQNAPAPPRGGPVTADASSVPGSGDFNQEAGSDQAGQ